MASTSASRGDSVSRKIATAATTLYSEHQTLLADMRKAIVMMKEIGVDLEKDNESGKVKELENAVAELLVYSENCAHRASAIESIGHHYRPASELTDFKKLLETEFLNLKASSSSNPQNDSLMRQFREAVWNVHHAGQPMPGDEQEDIIMTSTQTNILNIKCPLTLRHVTELEEPVWGVECKHIYDKEAIMFYISKNKPAKCPIPGCPKVLQVQKVASDPFLRVEIEELRSSRRETAAANVVEDFTELD